MLRLIGHKSVRGADVINLTVSDFEDPLEVWVG